MYGWWFFFLKFILMLLYIYAIAIAMYKLFEEFIQIGCKERKGVATASETKEHINLMSCTSL